MHDDIMSKVRRVIQEQLDVEDSRIKPESRFVDDLGADSLAIVELVLKLEETFGVTIPETESEKIRTVQDAVNYIQQHASAA
jgi:acyl carrier protein